MTRLLSSVILLLACAACAADKKIADPLRDVDQDGDASLLVVADASNGKLRLTNRTGAPVVYLVLERELWKVALPPDCGTPTGCPLLEPGEEREIAYNAVAGTTPARNAVARLTWWHMVPSSEGRVRPDSVRVVEVKMFD